MNLFIIYIGGRHTGSFIELHDIRFIAAKQLQDSYAKLQESWWGIPKSLHIDAWGILQYADGHSIQLFPEPPKQKDAKLFFINLGGYDQSQFTELHKNIFLVAADESEARSKALKIVSGWELPHPDNVLEVDSCLSVNYLLEEQGYHIHLKQQTAPMPFEFKCQYIPIGKTLDLQLLSTL